MNGQGLQDERFRLVQVDFKTGLLLGETTGMSTSQLRAASPSGEGGLAMTESGTLRKVYPVAADLDMDRRRQEAAVYQCIKADNVCIRKVKTGIPPGRYKVQFLVAFHDATHTPPHDLVFSVGRPFDARTFQSRFVDVKITPDVAAVLLHPDAVRVRVGKKRYEENRGKGWLEIEGDIEVTVGLDGALGFIVSKRFEEGVFVDAWSFGGLRLEPVFGAEPVSSPRIWT